jgi:hypothetical protein
MNIYRIVSIETFIDVLHNRRERYVRPSCWDDTFEGYLFQKLHEKESRNRIIKEIYNNVCPKNYISTIDNVLKLEHSRYYVYGQCWSKEADSDALWRIYSYGKHSIQIQSTKEKIYKMLSDKGNIAGHHIGEISYDVDESEDIIVKQLLQLKSSLSIYEPFLHKRVAFEHEKEVRVLIDDVRWNQVTKLFDLGATWKVDDVIGRLSTDAEKIDEIVRRLEKYLDCCDEKELTSDYYVENINLNEYITAVTVNPLAEDWYVELIGGLCKDAGIKFNGKSRLYQSVK